MRRSLKYLILCLAILMGCSRPPSQLPSYQESIPAAEITTVRILLDRGNLTIAGSQGSEIQISSSADCNLTQTGDVLELSGEPKSNHDFITITLPRNLILETNTFQADITLLDVVGDVRLRSTAGDISLENFQGEAALKAGRGDIKVLGGSGAVVLINELGSIKLESFVGHVTMSTIMGEIEYRGMPGGSDPISLETDHGPITAFLPADSSYQIAAHTASGDVVCWGGNLALTSSGCEGSTGAGKGIMKIRTVSGRIKLQIQP